MSRIYLLRHGETEWSASGRHTSDSDIPLTPRGEDEARALGALARNWRCAIVLTSPLQRARRTCELAGFGDLAEVDPDLVEYRYGAYEGRTTAEIREQHPGWNVFRDGCPGGESVREVTERADRVVARLRGATCDVLIFSHAHFLRCLAVRWLGLDLSAGAMLLLSTASVSILGYDHGPEEPAILRWNDVSLRDAAMG
ncbi:Alpha-ribazole phosphatase [Aquisphaera giovannonii]|uniref:Alpha-ribazole phosphatase n=1 Tax=Aquisphaera giovannonii TaxID=406548 RepID=A0A5B9VZL1_9BACT|nr:histidine phosphatase family protein [Aquisphaera giovannonii]QEH33384.1 Alpha-ribazole phosphatase [Aquisphaera giovannonii]